eukprot:357630-Chlamydomonas_euryale.AAC.4
MIGGLTQQAGSRPFQDTEFTTSQQRPNMLSAGSRAHLTRSSLGWLPHTSTPGSLPHSRAHLNTSSLGWLRHLPGCPGRRAREKPVRRSSEEPASARIAAGRTAQCTSCVCGVGEGRSGGKVDQEGRREGRSGGKVDQEGRSIKTEGTSRGKVDQGGR